MGLIRTDDHVVAMVQRRGFCHFTSTTERARELPNPEVGAVSVIGAVFEYWTGTAWAKFPPP